MENSEYLLEMKKIVKQFPGVLALNQVDLELKAGEVLSILGENGAGKSTLIKILSGAQLADSGEIIINGEVQHFKTPKEANEKGVAIIYQELNYLNDLTVAENIYLNRWPRKGKGRVDWKKMHADARKILDSLEVDVPTKALMRNLSVAEKQLVEIAKAISQDMKILVMDEPTSALAEKEVDKLFALTDRLRKEGKGVIFISHRLDELFQIADRVLVLRDGERVGLVDINEVERAELIQMMVGRKVNVVFPKKEIEKKETVLEVQNIRTNYLKDISFSVRKGEILAIFGLMGAGRTELAQCIFGSQKMTSGKVFVEGKEIAIRKPADAIKNGISYVTAERKKDGLILIQSLKANVMTASLDTWSSPMKLNLAKEKELANKWTETLRIKTPGIDAKVEGLSGGNQQKVVLAKWLSTDPKVLLLNEPTRGIDVGAKTEIYNLIEQFCENGLGVVMISSELPEILQLADRCIVLCEGRLTGEYEREELSQELLMHSAIGEV